MLKNKVTPLDWGKVTSCTTNMDGYRSMTVVVEIPISSAEEVKIIWRATTNESISSV